MSSSKQTGENQNSLLSKIQIKIVTTIIHVNEYFIFYKRLSRFYKNALKNSAPLIFDVGSNKGQTIDFFLKTNKNCTIHSFEPNTELYNKLCIKYKDNKKVILNNCGVSDKVGKLLFKEMVLNETSTFEELNHNSEYLKMKSRVLGVTSQNMIKKTYEVDVITLGSYINSKNIKNIDVLKIDTEGHEYKCLLGLFTQKDVSINYIQLEHHNDDMYENKVQEGTIEKLLNNNGFFITTKIDHGFGDFVETIYQPKG